MLTQATLERIRQWGAGAYPVLSVYLNLGSDIRETGSVRARLLDMLKPIESTIASEDHAAATSLRTDVERVVACTERVESDPGRGVAIFACHGRDLFEYISLPRTIGDHAAVGPKPYVRPLVAVLEESRRCLAVVVDRWRAQIFEFFMGQLRAHEETVVEGQRKKNFGGWYGLNEYSARHHAEELAHRHYRETVAMISELDEKEPFELLFVGGHRGTMDEFMPFVSPELHKRLAGTFVIDPHTMTPAIVQQHCVELEETYEREQLDQLVSTLHDEAARDGSAVLGIARVLDGANAKAVELLLLADDAEVPGAACDVCGWLGVDAPTCPVCTAALRRVPDVIGDLIEVVVDEGGKVRRVLDQTALAEQVGAMLRFPISERREEG